MGKKKIVLPLTIVCVVAAIAVPYFLGAFDDGTITSSEPETDGSGQADAGEVAADASDDEAASGDGSPADQLLVDDLIQSTDPSSPHSDLIRSRLDPLTAAANNSVEPFPTPEPTTLYQATLAHPAATQDDLRYVETLQPLPEDLDQALARVVLAHGVSTQMLAQSNPTPGADLAAALTMATALDTAMPTLERYIDHPVWNPPPADTQDAQATTLEVPSLPVALLDLYGALGYDQSTLDALEPQVRQATSELPAEHSRALARLVTAKANVQRASAATLTFFAMPASHPQGPVEEGTRTIDEQLAGSPAEDLTVATEQLRAAAEQAHETIHHVQEGAPDGDDAPGEDDVPDEQAPDAPQVLHEPWVDPLGLIVVGTQGDDTFDARQGGDPGVRGQLGSVLDQGRSTVGDNGANVSKVSTVPTVDEAKDDGVDGEAGADATNGSSVPEAGWHMLVLDPGGDDIYRNNAGGIDATNVIVHADADARGLTDGARTLLLRGDEACDPLLGQCEPPIPGAPSVGSVLRSIPAQGPAADLGTVPMGVPLTASVVDVDGDDTYTDTGPTIQGAARGLGVGLLFDHNGTDTYQATAMAQGAAEDYGIGLLIDGDGNDTYEMTQRGQGWVDVPNPNVRNDVAVPGLPPQAYQFELARITEGSLIDTGGHDEHRIEDLFSGQGMAQVPDGFVRNFAQVFGYPAERALAQLVDVGGDDQLPVPAREIQGQTVHMRPSRVNSSGEEVGHFWLTRRAPQDPNDQMSFLTENVDRYKTAVHADPNATPQVIGADAIRAGSFNVTCREGSGWNFNQHEELVCGIAGSVQIGSQVLLVGEPDHVEDPPALTLTFGGDTSYNGTIAAVETQPGDGGRIVISSVGIDQQFPSLGAAVPRTVVDLAGNDTYTGGNETIGFARNLGSALVVDRAGQDEMRAGNRSIAYADVTDPNGVRSPVAAVLDLDGDLTATSERASQAYAAQSSERALFGDRAYNSLKTSGATQAPPPMALLDAGARSQQPSVDDAQRPALPSGSLDLTAGNASQAFSDGLGVAVLVGSPGDDSYTVDGWGQGVHDQQQGLARVCGFDTNPDTLAEQGVRGLDPWLGGLGLMLDPDGDDAYTVDSGVGVGDVATDTASCADGKISTVVRGSQNVDLLGLGAVLDVRGQDDYVVTEDPPRPDDVSERYCSGANRTDCEPNDDRAWITINETRITRNFFGEVKTPGPIGFGIDNVRNAHHLLAAACRDMDLVDKKVGEDEGAYAVVPPEETFECDRAVQQMLAALPGDIVDDLPTRDLSLEVALPSEGTDLGVASGQTADPEDQTPADRLPLPSDVSVPQDPEPLFLGDVAETQCEDRESSREVTPRGNPDVACLSLTREVDLGQWITNDPAADRLDPGDTVACNCSVRLQIDAQQNSSSISLSSMTEHGLYPDRGRVSTYTTSTQTWYDAFNRFRVPLTAEEPIQDGRLRGDFVKAEAAADFPVNLSALPTGLARVEVTAVVEDMASEESGGLVDETVRTWPRTTLIQQRSFEQGHVAQIGDNERVLFLEAPGPVDPDQRPTITINASDTDTRGELTSEDWRTTAQDRLVHDLPVANVIDGPKESPVVPQEGASACASLILEAESDGEGVCWTGESFVVGLPLGDVDPANLTAVHAGDERVELTQLSLEDSDAEPRVRFGAEDTETVDTGDEMGRIDVRGAPGATLLEDGEKLATELLKDRPDENWALVTVEPDVDDAVGIAPLTPSYEHNQTAFEEHACEEPDEQGCTPSSAHEDFHHVISSTHRGHPHIEVWSASEHDPSEPDLLDTRENKPLFLEGETQFTIDREVLGCANLNYARVDDVDDVLIEQAKDKDIELNERTCVTFADGGQLHYLVPLGDRSSTQLLRLEAQLLQTDGETVSQEILAHLDPQGVQGQLAVQPASSRDTNTTVTLQMYPQTAEHPRLTSGESDLTGIELEARAPNGSWTSLDDPWAELPTPERPNVGTKVDVASFVPEDANTSVVELRGTFSDESNNTLHTNVREFIFDRTAPNVTNARVVSGAGQSKLLVTVDEAVASVECAEEECPLTAGERVPGAQPEPFLDPTRLSIGPRDVSMPILNLQRGPNYTVQLELTDTLGNEAVRNITVDTFTPLGVEANIEDDELVNKTITLNWTTETQGSNTLSTFTSAYLLLPEGPCAILQANPGVVPGHEAQTYEKGPLSVQGQAGERACEVPEGGVDTELVLYALAPAVDALAIDRVPVHLDATDPTVNVTGPAGWVNASTTVEASSQDSLPTELELFVDEVPQDVDGTAGSALVSGEGIHDVLARATDEAGNTAVNRTTVRIDRTSPSVSAEVLGVRGGLALVNATASDGPAGVRDVQLRTSDTSGPRVPDVGNQSVLLSVPVDADEDEIVLRARDLAGNVQDLRLPLENVPRVESGPLVTGLELSTPSPNTLHASFETTNRTTPVVIVDAGDRHVEEALDPGHEHELTIEPLPPGREAEITITLPRGGDLVPALNASAPLPADDQPPTALGNVEAKPVEGGVALSWEPADDDVGVREVLIHRDGSEIARTAAGSYTDEPRTVEEHTYKLAAVDQAGNRGPWTEVAARPIPSFQITEFTTTPEALTPEQPVTIEATVQTPAGLQPDVVTVSVGEHQIPMKLADEGPYTSTYQVQTRLPTLNVAAEDTALVVNATAGDRSETERYPAPVVASQGPAGSTPTEDVPGVGVPAALAVLGLLALARRRWCI